MSSKPVSSKLVVTVTVIETRHKECEAKYLPFTVIEIQMDLQLYGQQSNDHQKHSNMATNVDNSTHDTTALHGLLRRLQGRNENSTREAISQLLESGVDPTVPDTRGLTALHVLSMNDYNNYHCFARVVNILMAYVDESKKSSFVNAVDVDQGESAILYALRASGGPHKVQKLLEFDADPCQGDPSRSTTLRKVLEYPFGGYQETIQAVGTKLLTLGADPTIPDENGETALHILAKNRYGCGFAKCVRSLMMYVDETKRKSFVNALDPDGKSAIFYVTNAPDGPFRVQTLLEYEADPFLGDPTRSIILHGLLHSFPGVMGPLFTSKYKFTSPSDTAKVITLLLDLGADPHVPDIDGKTPLHILTEKNFTREYCLFLNTLMANMDDSRRLSYINAVDAKGKTAILLAKNCRDAALKIQSLLDKSADPFLGDPTRTTLLYTLLYRCHCIKEHKTLKAVTKLLQLGAEPNVLDDENGQMTLHIVAKIKNIRRQHRIVATLLQHGADPSMADGEGHLPLNYLGDPSLFDSTVVYMLLQHMLRMDF